MYWGDDMGINLYNIMKLDALKDAKILAGENNINNAVTGITIMEAPDIADWIKEGQVLLSSLYSLNKDEKLIREFIRKLAYKKLSALIVKSRNKVEIPNFIIDECNKVNLMLIKIPEYIPYTKIMYPVMGELFDSQVNRVNYYKKSHDIFMRIALDNKGIKAIASALSEIINSEILIYDTNKNILASTISDIQEHDILNCKDSEERCIKGNLAYFNQQVFINEEIRDSITIPIRVLKQTKCYISIIKREHEIDELEFIAVENATTILSVEMIKQLAVAEIEQKFKNDLIDDLLCGNISSSNTIYERADLIGWNLKRTYMTVIFKINILEKYLISEFSDSESFMTKVRYLLDNLIGSTIGTFMLEHITRVKNNNIIILWPYNCKLDKEKNINYIKKVASKLQVECKKNYNINSIEVGIGEIASSINEIAKSCNEAREALKFGEMIHGKNSIESFDNLGVYRLLCKYNSVDDLNEFVPKTLRDLIDYDKKNAGNLTHTLEVFINCDCNASKAAQELYIHYKTLLYRINKIKNIMNVDFFGGENKLEIQIGLKILRVLGKIIDV